MQYNFKFLVVDISVRNSPRDRQVIGKKFRSKTTTLSTQKCKLIYISLGAYINKLDLKRYSVKMWIGFMWFRMRMTYVRL